MQALYPHRIGPLYHHFVPIWSSKCAHTLLVHLHYTHHCIHVATHIHVHVHKHTGTHTCTHIVCVCVAMCISCVLVSVSLCVCVSILYCSCMHILRLQYREWFIFIDLFLQNTGVPYHIVLQCCESAISHYIYGQAAWEMND